MKPITLQQELILAGVILVPIVLIVRMLFFDTPPDRRDGGGDYGDGADVGDFGGDGGGGHG